MVEDAVRDEIAFIRRAIDEGRGYVTARRPDLVAWGIAIALLYIGTYATVRGWWRVDPAWFWVICIVPAWLFSLRGFARRFRSELPTMARAVGMLWLGCGITLAALLSYTGEMRGWFVAVTAGVMAIVFFASSFLCNLAWMRWVAVAWWLGEFATFAIRHRPEVLALAALLALVLLVLPGIALLRGRPSSVSP